MPLNLTAKFGTKIPFWTMSSQENKLSLFKNKNEDYIDTLTVSQELADKIRILAGKASTFEASILVGTEPKKVLFLGRKINEQEWEGFFCGVEDTRFLAEKLIQNNSFTETILSEVNSLVVVIDQDGYILKVGKYFEEFSGMPEEDLIGKNAQELFMSKEQAAASLKNIASFYNLNEGREVVRPIWIKGKEYQIHWRNILIQDWSSNKKYLICAGTDITARVENEKMLELLSKKDPLTKLWNRTAIEAHIKARVAEGVPFSIVFLDFNEFKLVNDTHGHHIGDELLVAFSRKIEKLTAFESIARLGGDEFLMLYTGPQEKLQNTLSLLKESFEAPLLTKPVVRAKFSTGVVQYPNHGATYEDLFRRVDLAMYHAKKEGLKEAYAFEEKLEIEAQKLSWLEENFQPALDNNEFFILLQPKVCFKSDKICGAEALVRWKSSVRGKPVFPDEFIPFAEKYGYIEKLGNKVIEMACIEIQEYIKQGVNLPVSVNISAKQLESLDVVDVIFENLAKYQVPADLFQIELTETAVAKDSNMCKQILKILRDAGIKVNLDDFGKGESSLFLLSDSDIDVLKIDKSFIDKIETDKGYALLKGLVFAAQGLNLYVVAEGIETQKQAALVKELNIEGGQGYLFSRPVTPKEVLALVLAQEKNSLV